MKKWQPDVHLLRWIYKVQSNKKSDSFCTVLNFNFKSVLIIKQQSDTGSHALKRTLLVNGVNGSLAGVIFAPLKTVKVRLKKMYFSILTAATRVFQLTANPFVPVTLGRAAQPASKLISLKLLMSQCEHLLWVALPSSWRRATWTLLSF